MNPGACLDGMGLPHQVQDDVSVKVTTETSQLQPIEYNRNP